jgi:hypothetical protein
MRSQSTDSIDPHNDIYPLSERNDEKKKRSKKKIQNELNELTDNNYELKSTQIVHQKKQKVVDDITDTTMRCMELILGNIIVLFF